VALPKMAIKKTFRHHELAVSAIGPGAAIIKNRAIDYE